MLKEALKMQLITFLVSIVRYVTIILLGIFVGSMLAALPGVTGAVLVYTALELEVIIPVLMVIVAVIRGT